jgi:chromosome segregation ATPase
LATLAQVSNNLVQTEMALKTSQEETAKRDAKIAGLEAQNQALDKQAVDLSTAITNLTTQIEETKRKLATSEGEKGFLEKELKRLMAEKAELEKQFNDLTVLRAQVSKLKEELSVARRLEWIRQGLFASSEQRGAQKLMQGSAATPVKAPKPAYDLNVEVSSDGSVKVIPPLSNHPAVTNSPPK